MNMITALPLIIILGCDSYETNEQYRNPPNEYDVHKPRTIPPPKPRIDQQQQQQQQQPYYLCKCFTGDGWDVGECDYSNSNITHTVRFIFAKDWPAYFVRADLCKLIF
jgi:hypothetical protein